MADEGNSNNVIRETSRVNKLTVFLALFHAFIIRSVFASFIYINIIPLLLYVVLYSGLFICLCKTLIKSREDFRIIHFSKFIIFLLLLLLIVLFSSLKTGNIVTPIRYCIPFLLPFAVYPNIKDTYKPIIVFIIIGIVLSIGCLFNFMFPFLYNAYIFPIFNETAQGSLLFVEKSGVGFPGFMSQVGYTSFFLSFSMGALFCFRHNLIKGYFIPLALVILTGMLFTGKRGPLIFMLIACLLIFFIEKRGRLSFIKIVYAALIFLLLYVALYLLATYTEFTSVQRIFNLIQMLIMGINITDVGREQLWNEAVYYFYGNMWTGVGWGYFKDLFTLRSTYVHNIYLQLLCETGIIGFIIFFTFFIWSLIRSYMQLKFADLFSREHSWILFSLYVQVFFLLYGLTGNPLYDLEEAILYFFAVGIGHMRPLNKSDLQVIK